MLLVIVVIALLAPLAVPQGKVKDADAAIKIGEKALMRVFGKEKIESERPFKATLKNGVWTVAGTLYCKDKNGQLSTMCVGGVATAKIAEADGRVLSTFHTQ